MTLETLKGVKSIGGVDVCAYLEGPMFKYAYGDGTQFITIDHDEEEISFKLQEGKIEELGVNGCTVETILETCLHMIEASHKKEPWIQNVHAVSFIGDAIKCLKDRDSINKGDTVQ